MKLADLFPAPNIPALTARLEQPKHPVDVVLDTDIYNEIDDEYALAYLLASEDKLHLRAITAAPFYRPRSTGIFRSSSPGDGMRKSYVEILKVLQMLGREDLNDRVFPGSDTYLPDETTPVDSPAANRMVELAREHTPETPLYIVAIGAITNVASALLLAPEIRDNVVVVWLGGHAQHYGGCDEFNMKQDIFAARVIFGSGAAVVQLPCMGVVSEFRFSRPELEYWFRDKSEFCNYLIETTYEYAALKYPYEVWSKPLWDVTAVGWLLDEQYMLSRLVPAPVPQLDLTYGQNPSKHPIRYVYYVKKDPLIEDLAKKIIDVSTR